MASRGWFLENQEAVDLMRTIVLSGGEIDTHHFDLRLKLLRSDALNAAAWPNGFIGLHSALFCFVQDEAELAAILGHELQHVLLQHARSGLDLERQQHRRVTLRLVTLGLSDIMQKARRERTANTRSKEIEADSLGLLWLMERGYDPKSTVRLWARLDRFAIDFEGFSYELHADHQNVSERLDAFERIIADRVGGARFILIDANAFYSMQADMLPKVIQDICQCIESEFRNQRPDSSGSSPYLNHFLCRYAELKELGFYTLGDSLKYWKLLHRARMALHGEKDGSLDTLLSEVSQVAFRNPSDSEIQLLYARALTLKEDYQAALDLYRKLESDSSYSGRKGKLRIRIRQLEQEIKGVRDES
jgi:hypothetical protein